MFEHTIPRSLAHFSEASYFYGASGTIPELTLIGMPIGELQTQAIRNSTGARRNITPPRPRTDASPRVARPTSPLGQRSRGYHTHTPDLPRMRSVSAPLASQADQLAYARSRTLSGARFPSGGASIQSYERPKARTASTSDSLCSYDQAQQVSRRWLGTWGACFLCSQSEWEATEIRTQETRTVTIR